VKVFLPSDSAIHSADSEMSDFLPREGRHFRPQLHSERNAMKEQKREHFTFTVQILHDL
jgi:hypothetical protein